MTVTSVRKAHPSTAGRLTAMGLWLRKRAAALLVFALLFALWEGGVWLSGIKEYL